LAIEPNRVSVAADFDLIGVPLSGNQGRAALIVLLACVPADVTSIDCSRAMLVESVRLSSSQFVNLDLEAGVHCNERLIVVRMGDTREVAIRHRERGIPEANKHTRIVVNAT